MWTFAVAKTSPYYQDPVHCLGQTGSEETGGLETENASSQYHLLTCFELGWMGRKIWICFATTPWNAELSAFCHD